MVVHLPVMSQEVLEVLNIDPGGLYVDATIGLGGHAEKILSFMNARGRIIGIDRDEKALSMARERLADERVVLRKGRFSELSGLIGESGFSEVDGILFDFGVSMLQFGDMARGFSFSSDEPLDMRMDTAQTLTAEEIVNTYPENELVRILSEYGEEGRARKIARAIAAYRRKKKIETCRELAGIVSRAYGGRGKRHPATKSFQALRVAVNDEIREIAAGLDAALQVLRPGGRLCAISYHSLEDRVVKVFLREADKEGRLKVLTKKPLRPSHDEVLGNPSSRSARLRGGEKV